MFSKFLLLLSQVNVYMFHSFASITAITLKMPYITISSYAVVAKNLNTFGLFFNLKTYRKYYFA